MAKKETNTSNFLIRKALHTLHYWDIDQQVTGWRRSGPHCVVNVQWPRPEHYWYVFEHRLQ